MSKWEYVKLGEVIKQSKKMIAIEPEKKYKQVTIRMQKKGVCLRGIIEGSRVGSKQFLANGNQFIVSKIDARNGAYGIVPNELQDAIVTADFLLFDVSKHMEVHFLNYFSNTKYFDSECNKSSEGTTNRVRLKIDKFLQIAVPLPPLAEQRRIVARLDALKSKIDEVKRLRQEQIAIFDSLEKITIGEIFDRHTEEMVSISEICSHPQYGFTASATSENTGVKILRITDIQDGEVNWVTVPYCHCDNPENYIIKDNDILFARTGGTTGKSFLVKNISEHSVFASYLIRLRTNEKVLPEYLYEFFQTSNYWKQVIDSKTGTGQPNVNGSKLANLKVPFTILENQTQIVSEIKKMKAKFKALKEEQTAQLAELEALLPSVLDKAFKGEF